MVELFADMLTMYESEHRRTATLRGLRHRTRFYPLSSQLQSLILLSLQLRTQQLCDVPPVTVNLQSGLEFRCMTLD